MALARPRCSCCCRKKTAFHFALFGTFGTFSHFSLPLYPPPLLLFSLDRGAGNVADTSVADDSVLFMEESTRPLRVTAPLTSLHSSVGGTDDPKPFEPTLANAPWLAQVLPRVR
eukprot:scaffold84695_cov62-Phaeocystis_antarctica.AAC.3